MKPALTNGGAIYVSVVKNFWWPSFTLEHPLSHVLTGEPGQSLPSARQFIEAWERETRRRTPDTNLYRPECRSPFAGDWKRGWTFSHATGVRSFWAANCALLAVKEDEGSLHIRLYTIASPVDAESVLVGLLFAVCLTLGAIFGVGTQSVGMFIVGLLAAFFVLANVAHAFSVLLLKPLQERALGTVSSWGNYSEAAELALSQVLKDATRTAAASRPKAVPPLRPQPKDSDAGWISL